MTTPTTTSVTARIAVPRATLLQLLAEAKRIVDPRAASPILHTVCLTIQGSEVAVAATDMRLTVLGRVAGTVTADTSQPQQATSGCLDAKKAHDIVKALGADVTLEIVKKTTTERQEGGTTKRWCPDCGKVVEKPNTGFPKHCPHAKTCPNSILADFRIVTSTTTTSTLSSGKSRFNLTTLSGIDFPKMPDAAALAKLTWQSLPTATLIDLIDGTLFSASLDTTRAQMNACLLESLPGGNAAPKLRMVSTDGYRLSRIDREGVLALPGAADKYTGATSILIPCDGVVELRKLCSSKGLRSVEVAIAKDKLYFRAAGQTQIVYSTELVDAQLFPPYMQVIPRDAQHSIVTDAASLRQTVNRLMLAASKETSEAAFHFVNDKLTLRTDNPDVGSAEEDVDFTGGVGYSFKIGVSLRYLGEALERIATTSAKLNFNGELDPILLHGVGGNSSRDAGDVFVIMPCRL